MIGMCWARCKGCPAQRQIAGAVEGRPGLSLVFGVLDAIELTAAGWTRDAGAWWCRYCTRRRNLMRGLDGAGRRPGRVDGAPALELVRRRAPVDVEPGPTGNVTDPPPPSGKKM